MSRAQYIIYDAILPNWRHFSNNRWSETSSIRDWCKQICFWIQHLIRYETHTHPSKQTTKHKRKCVDFKYCDRINIFPDSYEIYFKNETLFGDKFILLQYIDQETYFQNCNSHFVDSLWIDPCDNIIMKHIDTIDDELKTQIAKYKFTTNILWEQCKYCRNEHTFNDITNFSILIPGESNLIFEIPNGKQMNGENIHRCNLKQFPRLIGETIHNQDLYVKPLSNSFEYFKIKSLIRSKNQFAGDKPLYIDTTLDVNKFDSIYGINDGVIQILSLSDIIITETGMINANECGIDKNMSAFCQQNIESINEEKSNDNTMPLKYGTFIGDVRDDNNNGCGGGIIELLSCGNIINNGIITSEGTNDSNYSCGTISIITKGTFINAGQIKGNIFIKCQKFVNKNGSMSNNQNIFIDDVKNPIINKILKYKIQTLKKIKSSNIQFTNVFKHWNITNTKQIELAIHSYTGHSYNRNPQNLLDGSTDTYYGSNRSNKREPRDWIIFEMKTNRPVKPTKISIRNNESSIGIRSISLFIGTNNNFVPLCPNIQNINNNNDFQEWFIGDKLYVSDYYLWTNNHKHIKIKILNTHNDFYC
eukprot:300124_1